VITVTRRARPTVTAPVTAERKGGLSPPDILLPTSVILWAIGVSRTNVTHLGQYGLPAVLPIVFYAGLLMLVASAIVELAQKSPSRIRMALHAVTLVVMLYGTAPLVYQEGRYSWLYKTIGVVQYVNAHGQLNKNIDIYQNWPGFFAFTAWFDKVAGVASPLVYAKWAQLVVELAALPLLYMAYSALSLPARQRWIAILLYSASNWIGQDYFSPQALGSILSLGIIAMALRWMFSGNSSGRRWSRWRWRDSHASWRYRNWDRRNSRLTRPLVVALVLVFFVLTFTHELSPYVVLMQLAALAVTGLIRPRWILLVLLGVAIAYFIPRFAFVNDHYGLISSFGSFFSNAAPPSATAGSAGLAIPASQALIQHSSAALSVAIWLLGLAGAWLRRRSRRTVLALVLLAYSPILVLAIGAYGNEGVLRVYLFSLPWAAALAAAALAPLPILARRGGHVSEPALRQSDPILGSTLRTSLALGAALVLFFPAFFGDDRANLPPQSEVDTIDAFMQSAPAGAIFTATQGAPVNGTARYPLFSTSVIFGPGALVDSTLPNPDIANEIAETAVHFTGGHEPSYVIVSPSQVAYNAAHPTAGPAAFRLLLASLAHSPEWILLIKSGGTYIYELPAGAVFVKPGSAGPDQR
jgi:hypothetical protein